MDTKAVLKADSNVIAVEYVRVQSGNYVSLSDLYSQADKNVLEARVLEVSRRRQSNLCCQGRVTSCGNNSSTISSTRTIA